ncbi:prostacyclin receptor [Hemicordylus capensis]|uniref:prostacyclin receptor n=1 Tax=Hemicordylus capensis TaxID=884348 RepID=UPI002304C492|nr:prostacyclin receptor [Hemicordylus capensis]
MPNQSATPGPGSLSSNCGDILQLQKDGNPATSSLMFLAGVVGNLAALVILWFRRKELRAQISSFYILVTGLALTDLLGTCVLSPVVFVAYSQNATLLGLAEGKPWLCHLFAFALMFFNLAAMLILCAMAVERCLAISYPFVYSHHNIRRWAKLSLPTIYAVSTGFCALPFLGIGKYKQYCPGTWCFVQMDKDVDGIPSREAAFSLSYATLMALLILAVFVCNVLVFASLCQMYHKQKARRRGSVSLAQQRRKSWFRHGEEEVDHLVLLVIMTIIFGICSLPLSVRAYVGGIRPDHREDKDMIAFRFSAFNPIVDPWLFIICRHAVFRGLRKIFCCHVGWPCWLKTQKSSVILGMQDGPTLQDLSVC